MTNPAGASGAPSNPPGLAVLNGRYRLLAIVASGGMATVYKAQDTQLNRIVAIKILRDRYAKDPQFVQRFREEAQAAANLNHPNIVTIFDVGRDSSGQVERQYIVMEMLEGGDLKNRMRERAISGQSMSVDESVNIARQIAEGVGYAHRRGLVHCDLKPQNVIVSPEGQAKVADFGIARAYTAVVNEKSDIVWGTPQYYSPEQASGAVPTPASDVYSIGVMLYELLGGRLPFDAKDSRELARLHMTAEATPLHELNPNVTLQLEAIVRRAMAKQPAQRFQDADQMARILASYLQQGDENTLSQPAVPPLTRTQPTGRATRSVPADPAATVSVNPLDAAGAAPTRVYASPNPPSRASQASGSVDAGGGFDIGVWLLGAVAVLCVLGLIPLYMQVYNRYNVPPGAGPTATTEPNPIVVAATDANAEPNQTATGKNTPVGIVLNVQVPPLVGKEFEASKALVGKMGLSLVEAKAIVSDVITSTILSQSAPAGTLIKQNSIISVTVAQPAPTQDIPVDLTTRILDDNLLNTLRKVGWSVVVSPTFDLAEPNKILSVEPPSGSKLSISGTLTLTVSNGGTNDISAELPAIQIQSARFGRQTYLPGSTVQFDVTYRATARVTRDYKVVWFLLDANGGLLKQGEDRGLRNNGAPATTSTWRRGTMVTDNYSLVVPGGVLGKCYVVIALYTEGEGRLQVTNPGLIGNVGNNTVVVGVIDVQ